jgi:hypothetical protein
MTAVVLLAFAGPLSTSAADPGGAEAPLTDILFDTIGKLDAAVFDAFNHCGSPAELQLHASYFAPDVEFYHDTGGVTWTRDEMIANTAKNACGNYRRELVAGSLKVFPIKDFGAIEQGVHRFCRVASDACEGMADFVIVWRLQSTKWQITRVLSYGHRPIE